MPHYVWVTKMYSKAYSDNNPSKLAIEFAQYLCSLAIQTHKKLQQSSNQLILPLHKLTLVL